jgi:hypothetical protein
MQLPSSMPTHAPRGKPVAKQAHCCGENMREQARPGACTTTQQQGTVVPVPPVAVPCLPVMMSTTHVPTSSLLQPQKCSVYHSLTYSQSRPCSSCTQRSAASHTLLLCRTGSLTVLPLD